RLPRRIRIGIHPATRRRRAWGSRRRRLPGISPGDAKFIIGGGQTGLNGYLTPNSNSPKQYFYVPGQPTPFDTRFAHSCTAQACTVAERVGEAEVNGTVGAGQAGFPVSAFDRHTLAPLGHMTFTTASGLNEGAGSVGAAETRKMATYLSELAGGERLV